MHVGGDSYWETAIRYVPLNHNIPNERNHLTNMGEHGHEVAVRVVVDSSSYDKIDVIIYPI